MVKTVDKLFASSDLSSPWQETVTDYTYDENGNLIAQDKVTSTTTGEVQTGHGEYTYEYHPHKAPAEDPEDPGEPEVPDTGSKLPCWVNGIVKGCDGKWAMYKKGVVDTSFTGIAKNCFGWWYVKDGYVNFDVNGIYKNDCGWWYVKNSKVDFCFTGIASNENGTWYVRNGKVDFTKSGIVKYNCKTYIVLLGKVILK